MVGDRARHRSRRTARPRRRCWAIVNTNTPLTLDIPMAEGLIEFAEAGQAVCITPFTLAGAMAPVTLAGALVLQNAEMLAGATLVQLVRPGAPVGVRLVHVERRHAQRLAGVRHARVHEGGAGQRPAGPSLRAAVPLVEHHRVEHGRRAGGLRERDVAVGRGDGRRQPRQPRRRLAGGRPHGELREAGHRRRDAADDRRVPASRSRSTTRRSALDAIAEVGHGGHFFASPHTMERYETAFYSPLVSDWRNFETLAGGRFGRRHRARPPHLAPAARRVRAARRSTQSIDDALTDYVQRRKSSM